MYIIIGNVYPIGGTHSDPVTNLIVPIEFGSLMIDITEQPVTIMGITIDENSGDVVPIGGMTLEEPSVPVLLYDSFTEILSQKEMKVTSVRFTDQVDWEVERLNGGERALMDVNELYHESRIIDALNDFKDALTGSEVTTSSRHEETALENELKDLQKSKVRLHTVLLRDGHDLVRRLERTTLLSETGGSPGMYEFTSTGQLLPILIGTEMKDPCGSGIDVPILGVEHNKDTGLWFPLGGTVEDPLGDGLVPIMLGEKVIDPTSEKQKHCVGVKYNWELSVTEPVTTAININRKKKQVPAGNVRATFVLFN